MWPTKRKNKSKAKLLSICKIFKSLRDLLDWRLHTLKLRTSSCVSLWMNWWSTSTKCWTELWLTTWAKATCSTKKQTNRSRLCLLSTQKVTKLARCLRKLRVKVVTSSKIGWRLWTSTTRCLQQSNRGLYTMRLKSLSSNSRITMTRTSNTKTLISSSNGMNTTKVMTSSSTTIKEATTILKPSSPTKIPTLSITARANQLLILTISPTSTISSTSNHLRHVKTHLILAVSISQTSLRPPSNWTLIRIHLMLLGTTSHLTRVMTMLNSTNLADRSSESRLNKIEDKISTTWPRLQTLVGIIRIKLVASRLRMTTLIPSLASHRKPRIMHITTQMQIKAHSHQPQQSTWMMCLALMQSLLLPPNPTLKLNRNQLLQAMTFLNLKTCASS